MVPRWKFQYGLSSLLIMAAIVAVSLGNFILPTLARIDAIEATTSAGGSVHFTCDVRGNGDEILTFKRDRHDLFFLCRRYRVSHVFLIWSRLTRDERRALTTLQDAECVYVLDEDLPTADRDEIRRIFPDSSLEFAISQQF